MTDYLKYAIIDIKTQNLAPADQILTFEENISAEEMKRYTSNILEKVKTIAIFSGNDSDGYRYMITSSEIELQSFIKAMNNELNGKGGGKGSAQGHVNASKSKIEEFFNNI